jgi:hypothetical protein
MSRYLDANDAICGNANKADGLLQLVIACYSMLMQSGLLRVLRVNSHLPASLGQSGPAQQGFSRCPDATLKGGLGPARVGSSAPQANQRLFPHCGR